MSKNNLGQYLHPPRVDRAKANSDPAMGSDRGPQEPAKPAAPKTPSDVAPTAEERFYRSAKPAPVKGIRGSNP